LLLYPETVLAAGTHPLMIAFSRSGETSEMIGAARLILGRQGSLLGIGCDQQTTLMRLAECVIEIPAGRERSVAQTRSFSGMFLAAVALMAQLSKRDKGALLWSALEQLPRMGEAFVTRARAEIGRFAVDPAIERIFFLGSGVRYGLACEASLKMKEMSLTNAEAFHIPEFRHGPMSMADERAVVVGLIGDSAPEEELAVLREAHEFGARTLALIERAPADRTGLDAIFAFDSDLAPAARDVLYLPPVQLLAYERAVAKGLDPDTSRNITTFVHRPTLAQRGE
jgi:glucosamine--fructose-6-phosphate aminotransferase (isomerizing)